MGERGREAEREIPSTLGKLIWNLTDPPALNAGARCHGWSILIILGTEERERGREWESKRGRERCTLTERHDWSRARVHTHAHKPTGIEGVERGDFCRLPVKLTSSAPRPAERR